MTGKLSPLVLESRLHNQGPPASLPQQLCFFSKWNWLSNAVSELQGEKEA